MVSNRTDVFFDNWTYLKVELNWLERLLLLAVARQKKELKEVERIAQTKADRATSHWWKGMVSLEGVAYDVPPERRTATNLEQGNYQQQIQARIQASLRQGMRLALPMVCDRLNLTPFEKNVILLGLAPEVHRRYGQLYGFLQTGRDCFELPKVDLALRLFCRTDQEWREARSRLLESSVLVRSGVVELWAKDPVPLLQRSMRLGEPWVDYLLEERSTQERLEQLIQMGNGWATDEAKEMQPSQSSAISIFQSDANFTQLVLPEALLETLQQIQDRMVFAEQVDRAWGFQGSPGVITLLVGEHGTGKTMAVAAIAQSLNEAVLSIDLELLTPEDQANWIAKIKTEAPKVLEIQSAERWLGRSNTLEREAIAQFLEQRRNLKALTFLSLRKQTAIRAEVRSRLDFSLVFPKPDATLRSRLWKQAFPPQVSLDPELDWHELGRKFPLTGGQIREKARSAAFFAAAESATTLRTEHILRAIHS